MTKKSWRTPELEVYGTVSDLTRQVGPIPPKHPGQHDEIPQGEDLAIQCPPGLFDMGVCEDGIGGTS
jgi:hypothetical protein